MKLFEPGKIGNMVTRNRILLCPMGTLGLLDLDMGFGYRIKDYYAARARGGTGIITTGVAVVSTALEAGSALMVARFDDSKYISRLSELCDAVHHHGAKLAIQLAAGFGRTNFVKGNPIQPISASAVPCKWDPGVMAREITTGEIDQLVNAYAVSAGMAKMAGVDAIVVRGAGDLIDQFLTSLWNKRTDKYGGDLDGRLRFPLEILAAARSAVGKDFPIIYKFIVDHGFDGGMKEEEGIEIARRLEKAGADAIHVAGGSYESWNLSIQSVYEPPAIWMDMAGRVKEAVNVPVIADGKMGRPEVAEKALRENKTDFVGLGRPLIADPEWVNKVKEGRLDDIVPCIADNEGCLGRGRQGKYLGCAVNPAAGMEREYALKPAEKCKNVLVIGGGPGGMEAARVAASRGHKVTL
ncbi:MAG: tRNA-dihydrouridine synthase, partial [Dehalococcoidales bacterium]|nr:tRNA-dihydrouridine synthase [Dehalococcoidales bacterium]